MTTHRLLIYKTHPCRKRHPARWFPQAVGRKPGALVGLCRCSERFAAIKVKVSNAPSL